MKPDAKRVIEFWFNRPPIEWIIAPDGIDTQIRSEFGELVTKARSDELKDWALEPESSLALVVLLEQFPRNIFRGTSEAFASDTKAYEIAVNAIAQDFDKQVTVIQASAFYLTLMQQESIISLIAARGLVEILRSRCGTEGEQKWVDMCVAAVGRHLQQLRRFGRYPTRNALLGRVNAEDEDAYLKEHVPSL